MNKIIKKIKKNTPIIIAFNKVRYYSKNKKLSNLIKQFEDTDSILDFDTFKNIVNQLFNKIKKPYMICGYGWESLYYGHFYILSNYAKCNNAYYYYLPKIEHGVNPDIQDVPNYEIERFTNFVFQSDYKKNQVHSVNPLKPVFVIGPFIHYADYVYSMDKLQELKKQFGKTLLVFPFHNYDFSSSESNDETFVNYVMDTYGEKYDTILVSTYWMDVNDQLYQLFKKRGAKLVSAGFRGDKKFMDRLKTILYLADDVCGNAFGTHIGYAIYMNKHYFHIKTERVFKDEAKNITLNNEDVTYERKLCELFTYENIEKCNLEDKNIKEFIELYWGCKEDIKTPNQMKEIIEICKNIYCESKGMTDRFDNVVKKYLCNKNELIMQSIHNKELTINE